LQSFIQYLALSKVNQGQNVPRAAEIDPESESNLRNLVVALIGASRYGEICEASFDMDFPAIADEDMVRKCVHAFTWHWPSICCQPVRSPRVHYIIPQLHINAFLRRCRRIPLCWRDCLRQTRSSAVQPVSQLSALGNHQRNVEYNTCCPFLLSLSAGQTSESFNSILLTGQAVAWAVRLATSRSPAQV
jgi:hypothetical protein